MLSKNTSSDDKLGFSTEISSPLMKDIAVVGHVLMIFIVQGQNEIIHTDVIFSRFSNALNLFSSFLNGHNHFGKVCKSFVGNKWVSKFQRHYIYIYIYIYVCVCVCVCVYCSHLSKCVKLSKHAYLYTRRDVDKTTHERHMLEANNDQYFDE